MSGLSRGPGGELARALASEAPRCPPARTKDTSGRRHDEERAPGPVQPAGSKALTVSFDFGAKCKNREGIIRRTEI